MKLDQKKYIWLILLVETICILIIGYYLYSTLVLRKNVLGAKTSITPISIENLDITDRKDLKYFYEFNPSTRVVENRAFMPKPATYTINSDTLNDQVDYLIQKPDKVFRIITLGDSYTFGEFVNTKDNWTEVLEDKLNTVLKCSNIDKFEIINLGMGGYGVEYISHRYEKRGTKYNPDLIIWFESGSGYTRNNELMGPLIDKYTSQISDEENKRLLDKGKWYAWDEATKEIESQFNDQKLTETIKESWLNFFKIRGNVNTVISKFTSPKTDNRLEEWSSGFNNIFINSGIRPLDNKKGELLLDGHPSLTGHLFIAKNIFNYLLKTNLINCIEK